MSMTDTAKSARKPILELVVVATVLLLDCLIMKNPLPDGWQNNLLQDRERCLVAIGFLDRLLDDEPESDQIFVERSKAYFGVDDWQASMADCRQAIKIDKKNLDAYRVSAKIMNRLSNPKAAINDINQTIDGQPNPRASDLAFRSILYSGTEQNENAIKDADAALKIDQFCSEAYIALALVHLNRLEYRKAMSDLRIAQDLTPDDARVPMLMAKLHLAKRECPAALRYADKMLSRDPSNWQAYQIKSEGHRLSHDFNAAIFDATMALGLANKTDLPTLHLTRASSYASERKFSAAIEDCQRALALQPDMVAAQELLSTFQREKVQQEDALQQKEQKQQQINTQQKQEIKTAPVSWANNRESQPPEDQLTERNQP